MAAPRDKLGSLLGESYGVMLRPHVAKREGGRGQGQVGSSVAATTDKATVCTQERHHCRQGSRDATTDVTVNTPVERLCGRLYCRQARALHFN